MCGNGGGDGGSASWSERTWRIRYERCREGAQGSEGARRGSGFRYPPSLTSAKARVQPAYSHTHGRAGACVSRCSASAPGEKNPRLLHAPPAVRCGHWHGRGASAGRWQRACLASSDDDEKALPQLLSAPGSTWVHMYGRSPECDRAWICNGEGRGGGGGGGF